MVKDENVSCRIIEVIVNEGLSFDFYYKRKVQGLTAAQITKRFQRCKKLVNQHGSESVDRIIFCDEKLFCTERSYKTENDVAYSATFDDISENLRTTKRFQNKNCIIVWATASHSGKWL